MTEGHRKSVLLITRNFPPLVGGMEKLNLKMLYGLAEYRPTILIGPRGARLYAPRDTTVYEAPVANLLVFLIYAKCMAIYLSLTQRPDICLAGSGLTAPYAWLAARLSRARAIVYVHGLDLIADNRIYRLLWLPFIRRCDAVIANSANTRRLAESVGISAARISVVHPGTDVPEILPVKIDEFRTRFDMGDRLLLLSVGRITRRKGLLPFFRQCWPAILEKHPTARFMVIGTEPLQAIRKDRGSALAEIQAFLTSSGLDGTVHFLGRVDDNTLTAAYQAACVHVFPVLESLDDVEGFGMVAIEAAANGLPTVAFAAGGVMDAVDEGDSGNLVRSDDYAAFTSAVIARIESGRTPQTETSCRIFAARMSWPGFHVGIQRVLES